MSRLPIIARLALVLAALTVLPQCSSLEALTSSQKLIYALSPQSSLKSPITNGMKDYCAPVTFSRDRYALSPSQLHAVREKAADWETQGKPDLMLLGTAQRGLPASYARTLSQRRAEAVRQAMIETGIDAAKLHSIGYGHDQPAIGTDDAVRVLVHQ